jgi:hypothetical protein
MYLYRGTQQIILFSDFRHLLRHLHSEVPFYGKLTLLIRLLPLNVPSKYELYLQTFRDLAGRFYFTGWFFENADHRIQLTNDLLAIPADKQFMVCPLTDFYRLPVSHLVDHQTYFEYTPTLPTTSLDQLDTLLPYLERSLSMDAPSRNGSVPSK